MPPNDYGPVETPLPPKSEKRIGAAGGRPTNSDWSYFNLEVPTGHGVIVVVGWPGQWSSLWTRDDGLGLRVRAGQELTHFKLLPGEEVRTPADRAPVLGRRLDPRAERLAALDARPQRPQARREAAAARTVRLQFASLRRDVRGQRREPEDVHRSLPGRKDPDRPLVDGRRLVSLCAGGLGQDRHLGSRCQAIPEGPAGDQRSRPRQRRQDDRLVRARASCIPTPGSRRTIPSGFWAARTADC